MTAWDFLDKHLCRVRFAHILGIVLLAGVFAMFGVIAFHELPDKNKEYAMLLVSAIVGGIAILFGFIWGSSIGSANKSATIAHELEKK